MEGVQSSARPICRFLVPSSVIPCSSVSAPGHHGHLETIERPHIKKANFEVPIPRPDSGRQNAKHPVDPNSSQGSSLNFPPPSRSAGWLSFQSSGSTGQSMLSVHNLFDFRGSILWSGIRPLFLAPLVYFPIRGPQIRAIFWDRFWCRICAVVFSFSCLSGRAPAESLDSMFAPCRGSGLRSHERRAVRTVSVHRMLPILSAGFRPRNRHLKIRLFYVRPLDRFKVSAVTRDGDGRTGGDRGRGEETADGVG